MAYTLIQSGPLASTGVLYSANVDNEDGITLTVNDSGGGSTIVTEYSDDNSTWVSLGSTTAKGRFWYPCDHKYIRFRVSAYVSGYVRVHGEPSTANAKANTPPQDDATKSVVTPTGSSTPRQIGDVLSDEVDVSNYRIGADVDDTNSFNRALATGKPVVVPYRATPYLISTWINLPNGASLRGKGTGNGRPTIKATTIARVLRVDSISNWSVSDIIFDGNKGNVSGGNVATINNSVSGRLERCDFINASASVAITGTSSGNALERLYFQNCGSTQIELGGASVQGNEIIRCRFTGGVGFGVWLRDGSNRNLITSCYTQDNGLELVGITYDCWGNRILSNHAEGCGDNGISVSGYNNSVVGNICRRNAYAGIYLYGKFNTVTGNECVSNGQAFTTTALQYAGIAIGGFWGGTAQGNSVVGNFVDDDQATITQYYGIRLYAASYTIWATGQTIAVGDYRTSGVLLYKATTAGTTGATAPTHTSGTVSDGAVSWAYIDSFLGNTREAYSNTVGPNRVMRFSGAAVQDDTTNKTNFVVTDGGIRLFGSGDLYISGLIRRRATAWASGQSVKYGDVRYNNGNVYRVTNVGGTTANAPVHGTGIVTGADGIGWYIFQSGQEATLAGTSSSTFAMESGPILNAIDSTGSVRLFSGNGTPESKVTSGPGSVYLRLDGAAGSTFYVKESGTGATGWIAK
jgi:parallel beta-helix repeat protein